MAHPCTLPGLEAFDAPTKQPEHTLDRPAARRRVRLPVLQAVVDSGSLRGEALACRLSAWEAQARRLRPRVRGQCGGLQGCCPFVSCRYHLWAERPEKFEELVEHGPDDWGDTCALDVADRTVPPKSRRLEKRRSDYAPPNEPIGRPGPVAKRQGRAWRWVWPESPLDAPHESNRAVVGRFLGGLSRETVRLDEVRALEALRSDPAILEAFPWIAEAELGEDEEDDDGR